MIYAPICIPTLNRYEHLRKCLESLSLCTGADQTEVYVALDYPPLDKWDKYAPGWEKNKEFLHSCGNMGFKKLYVIEREENYGIWRPGDKGNFRCLMTDIEKKYDRYICSEDDNVFAPCFLEYMNKGLEMFENDERVYSIAGYKFYYNFLHDNNTYIRQTVDYSPWGVGHWTKKELPKIDYHWFRHQISCRKLWYLYKRYGWASLYGLFAHAQKNNRSTFIDNDVWTYMQVCDKQQIVPIKTLVENIGLDGSGVDMANAKGQEWCDPRLNPLSTELHFDFVGTGLEYEKENREIYVRGKYWRTKWFYFTRTVKALIKIIYLDIKKG